MATLREYFDTDFSNVLNLAKDIKIGDSTFEKKVIAKVHFDFDSNSKFLSFYIFSTKFHAKVCKGILLNINKFLEIGNAVSISTNLPGEKPMESKNLNFSGRVFLYSEDPITEENFNVLKSEYAKKNLSIQYRGPNLAIERSKIEKPLAFISHDSRDKADIAKPIAIGLSKLMCPVWFDEFSLKLGDNLRESIKSGIKESEKCVLVLSKNFLSNPGWTKTEFDSIFTKELIEKQNSILPIWVDVSKEDVYEYSPSLANKVAIKWEVGEEEVIRKIHQTLK
jgi:hypothetical protein